MKQTALLSITVATLLALSACGGEKPAEPAKPASAASGASADAGKTYTVVMDDSFAPFESLDDKGNIVGFDKDIIDAIAAKENLSLKFVARPFDGIFETLKTGDSDIAIAAITITEDRKQTMAFTDPYFDATQVIVVNDKGAAIKSAKDLEKHLVAVKTGTTGDIAISKLMGATNTNIKRYESLPLALKEVVAGGADAAVGDNGVVQNFVLNNNKDGKQLQLVSDPEFAKEHYGFALAKDRSDDLLAKLNSGIGKIKADGTYETIYQKWFGGQANAAASSASAAAPASAPASAAQ